MSELSGRRSANTIEFALITVVFVCLPLFEAPKNVFSVLFLMVWGVCAIRNGAIGGASPFNLPIVGLTAILWIAPIFSVFGETITPLNSAPRWTLIALFVLAASSLDYTRAQVTAILVALIVGGVAAVAESLWVWSFNGKHYPEFRSVGHVNHSSMYSLIPFAASFGALYIREHLVKVLGMAGIISTLAFLPPSKSIVGGVAITTILMVAMGVWAFRRWSLRGLMLSMLSAVIVTAAALATPPAIGLRAELELRVLGDDILSQRDKIFNSALVVWDRHPLIGTGWFSFEKATSEQEVRGVLAEDGIAYDHTAYAHLPHGHNLWTTMLIERGLLGVVLVTVLLLLYFWTFLPLALAQKQIGSSERGLAVAALLIAVGFTVAGLGNTTMMNEHGQAGMAFIAVCYGYLRSRGLVGNH